MRSDGSSTVLVYCEKKTFFRNKREPSMRKKRHLIVSSNLFNIIGRKEQIDKKITLKLWEKINEHDMLALKICIHYGIW